MKLIFATIVSLVIGAAVAAVAATTYTIWAFADAVTEGE
jgi:uncharacterized protein (DUF697 family)